jgi:hypothetical protein
VRDAQRRFYEAPQLDPHSHRLSAGKYA